MKNKILISSLIFLISCSVSEKRGKLDPESEKFLSETRYIITSQEKKEFLRLPPEKRKDYIEEFWARRPAGFKDEYYKRIDEANRLFRGGKPGWLQERGMVYIIYGPPSNIERYPMGSVSYPYAHEIWYYEYLQIVFYDPDNSGNYRLTSESLFLLDNIRRIPTSQVLDGRPSREKIGANLKFELETEKVEEGMKMKILIPYENIYLIEEKGSFNTELELRIEISGTESWNKSEVYKISYSKEEIEKLSQRNFKIEIPLKLKKGKYKSRITVINRISKEKVSKRTEFLI